MNENCCILLQFHLTLWVHLTIFQHWFRKWLATDKVSHYLNHWWPSLLVHICTTRPQWVNDIYDAHLSVMLCMISKFLPLDKAAHYRGISQSLQAPEICWLIALKLGVLTARHWCYTACEIGNAVPGRFFCADQSFKSTVSTSNHQSLWSDLKKFGPFSQIVSID